MRISQRHWVAITLSSLFTTSLNAQDISIKNFFYRDYLDLGQNKGIFAAGAENVILNSAKNPSISLPFTAPIINQSSRSNQGNSTALGRNFAVTAYHVSTMYDTSNTQTNSRTWGQTTYERPSTSTTPSNVSGNYAADTKFMRFSKYIVEGQTDLVNTTITSGTKLTDSATEKANIEALKNALQSYKDENGNILVFQAGQGLLSITGGDGAGFRNQGINGYEGMRGGSVSKIQVDGSGNLAIDYKQLCSTGQACEKGLTISHIPLNDFKNTATIGDSGSGYFVYNTKDKKWELLGVVATTNYVVAGGTMSFVSVNDFNSFKQQFEQRIDLQNHKWVFQSSGLTDNTTTSSWVGLQNNKDLILSSGGNIELNQNMDRNVSGQVGGLVFEAKSDATESNPTIYTITSKQGSINYGFNGAGLDIGERVNVKWNIGFISQDKYKTPDNALHKIGKGTLTIGNLSNNITTDKYGYLRVGEGKVVFDTDKQAFSGVYVTSNRATLELVKGKAQAFGAEYIPPRLDTDLKNHFILKQDSNTNMGLYFGNGGGILDIKGNNLTINTISSNDSKANVINSDSSISTLEIEGYGYNHKTSTNANGDGNKTNKKENTIIHASFGQTDSNAKNNTNNNINLIYKGDLTTQNTQNQNTESANLIFDGNVNVKGLEVSNGSVTLQGHPTTHAYIRDNTILEKIKKAEGKDLPAWMDLSRPSTLEQPDWDKREFNIEKISLTNSNLNIGREAEVKADIIADATSSINLGGNITHFIDKKDGENTSGNGFTYYQVVEGKTLDSTNQELANKSIAFEGSITANGSKINSYANILNAKLTMSNAASLHATFLTLDRNKHTSGAIASLSGSNTNANIENLILKGLTQNNYTGLVSANSGSSFKVTQGVGFEGATFDLKNLSSAGISNDMLANNYDIFALKASTITGTNTNIMGNVGVQSGSSLSLQNIQLSETIDTKNTQNSKDSQNANQNTTQNSTATQHAKNSIIVEGKDSKLNVSQKITTTNQDNTQILIIGEKEVKVSNATSSSNSVDFKTSSTQSIDSKANLASTTTTIHKATLSATQGIELNGMSARGIESSCATNASGTNGANIGAACFDSLQDKEKSTLILASGGELDANVSAKNLNLAITIDKDSGFGTNKDVKADNASVGIKLERGREHNFNINADNKSHVLLESYVSQTQNTESSANSSKASNNQNTESTSGQSMRDLAGLNSTNSSTTSNTNNLDTILQSSTYKGSITGNNNARIDSYLSVLTASVDLKNGANLHINNNGVLQLKDSLHTIALSGSNTSLNVNTIIANSLNTLTLSVNDKASLNVRDFIFYGGNVSSNKYYGENLWLENNASVSLSNGGNLNSNVYIKSGSFNVSANDFELASSKRLYVDSGSFSVANGNGTLSISNAINNTSKNEQNQTIIHTQKGASLNINKLLANNNANVMVMLDMDKAGIESSPLDSINSSSLNTNINQGIQNLSSITQSSQQNFHIQALNNSQVYVNEWDMNRAGFNSLATTSLSTDSTSRITFGVLNNDMAKNNALTSPIGANISITQSLNLENVGKWNGSSGIINSSSTQNAGKNPSVAEANKVTTQQATQASQTQNLAQNLATTTQIGVAYNSQQAPQAQTSDERFHALALQGNTIKDGISQNDGKNLTLDNGARIEVKLDSSISADNAGKNGFELNKYYTLISAGSITDNRADKRIYFDFAKGASELYWVTLIENGEVKVKFSKDDPSGYNELKKYVGNDKLLAILIEHNPQDSFIQMAGRANQHDELNKYIDNLNHNMETIAHSNTNMISNRILFANNEAINTRIIQVKSALNKSISQYRLAANDDSNFSTLKTIFASIEAAKKLNNSWANVGGGYFSQGGGDLSLYGTNVGYDRMIRLGDNEYLIGAMLGIGGSQYSISGARESGLFYNGGFYIDTAIALHELQSNINLSYIDSTKTIQSQGNATGDSMRSGTFGFLWSIYYKYPFSLGNLGAYQQTIKPIGMFNVGFNGIGAFNGAMYKQQAYNNLNFMIGAGAEYSLAREQSAYSLQVILRQGLYSSSDQIFVSLNNAQSFVGYDLRSNTLGIQIQAMGARQLDNALSLQYGIQMLCDIQGSFGIKGDVRVGYRF